jgi:hypothetical protein
LKRDYSKSVFLKNLKKITNEHQLYDAFSVQVVSGACLNFFFIIFKDGRLENFERFLKIPFQINLKEKSKKNVVVGFFYFLNFALKNTFPTSPQTCSQTNEW